MWWNPSNLAYNYFPVTRQHVTLLIEGSKQPTLNLPLLSPDHHNLRHFRVKVVSWRWAILCFFNSNSLLTSFPLNSRSNLKFYPPNQVGSYESAMIVLAVPELTLFLWFRPFHRIIINSTHRYVLSSEIRREIEVGCSKRIRPDAATDNPNEKSEGGTAGTPVWIKPMAFGCFCLLVKLIMVPSLFSTLVYSFPLAVFTGILSNAHNTMSVLVLKLLFIPLRSWSIWLQKYWSLPASLPIEDILPLLNDPIR